MKDYLYKGLLVIIAIASPIQAMLFACGALIFADMLTGVFAAHKRKKRITSAELRRSVSKMFVYQTVIISAFILEKYMLDDLVPVSKIVSGVIGMVEFKSILENASVIAGKDILQMVLEKLGSKNLKGSK